MEGGKATVVLIALLAFAGWPACRPADDFGSNHQGDDDDTSDDDDSTEIEVDSGGPGRFTAIDTDVHNAAHIVHYTLFWHHDDPATTVGQLRYATNGGAQWATGEVDTDGDRGAQTVVVLDGEDDLHVSFFRDGAPAYAFRDNLSWSTETVDPATKLRDVAGVTSLDVGPADEIHLSYFDGEDLLYARPGEEGWTIEVVDALGSGYGDHALAVDSAGTVHIVYYDAGDAVLRHAARDGDGWTVEVVDDDGDVGRHASLALDSDDQLHVAYRDATGDAIRYAHGTTGDWSTALVDDDGRPGGWCTGIDVGSDGAVHLSYYADDEGDLRHATNASGSWEVTPIDIAGDVGRYSSIAVDLHGEIHIAYQAWKADEGEGALKYASNLTGFWEIELVEDVGDLDRE